MVYCDAEIAKQGGVQEYTPGQEIDFRPVGRGGTDFRPPFARAEREGWQLAAAIYLTDLEGPFPEREPAYPVLWVATSKAKAPWARRMSWWCRGRRRRAGRQADERAQPRRTHGEMQDAAAAWWWRDGLRTYQCGRQPTWRRCWRWRTKVAAGGVNCGDRTDAVIEANRRAFGAAVMWQTWRQGGRQKADGQAVPEAACQDCQRRPPCRRRWNYEHPRKRTKAEAERVRQINLLARLWQSKALADGLLAGRPVVPAEASLFGSSSIPRRSYTRALNAAAAHINQTKLTGYITWLGANRRRAGRKPGADDGGGD